MKIQSNDSRALALGMTFGNERKLNSLLFAFILSAVALFSNSVFSQNTYTLGTGTVSSPTLGVNPFATINVNSRSQYLYLSQELLDQGAISGNIVSLALNITVLGLPTSLKPENVTIKMGLTTDVTLGTTLIPNLPVHYTSPVENINSTGWYTINLTTPFEWDGQSNIIVEICRNNDEFGTSYEVASTLYNVDDYRTVGLYSNSTAVAGCDLTGATPMTNSNRRMRPNMRFTMTMPCDGTPDAGVTTVTAGPYCSGAAFTLGVDNGSIESGLSYQWQASPNGNGLWQNVDGAVNTNLTTTQSIATYYRRATTCLESQQTINSLPIFVDSEGCYCNAQVINENETGITNVTFAAINNTSSADPLYTNNTSIQTEAEQGSVHTLSARVNANAGTNYTQAWIDWNGNAVFEAAEGYNLGNVTSGADVNSGVTATVTVPADALPGNTIMRVRTARWDTNTAPPACGPVANGETEDYTIVVTELLGVNDQISAVSDVIIYPSQNNVVVSMQHNDIASVKVYDLSGRKLASKTAINASEVSLEGITAKNQVLIFRITTTSGTIINKKVVL